MDLKTLKDLLKLLREKGVTEFKMGDVEIKLSDEAPQSKYKRRQEEAMTDDEELSEEDLIYYSATPPTESIEQQ
jgi:ribosome maturation protein Sdo1